MLERTAAIQKRIDVDILGRSGAGIAVYSILFPVILYPPGFYSSHSSLSWFFTLSVWLLCVLRVLHKVSTERFYSRAPVLWMRVFSVFALAHGLLLGSFFALVLYDPALQPAYSVTLLVVAGMASGALSSLSPYLNLALLYPQALLLPGILVTINTGYFDAKTAVMVLYLAYLSVIAGVTNREYLRTFTIESELEKQKKELETLSRVDALTGIFNRGYFNNLYEMQWKLAVRQNTELTLMLIDADHFKAVNDKYGHLSGDECLIQIAAVLRDIFGRTTDVCSRFGGEEFVVLVGATSVEQAEKLAEKVRVRVQSHAYPHKGESFHVTVSIGIASTKPQANQLSSTLIDMADQALYEAKEAGRNNVIIFRPKSE